MYLSTIMDLFSRNIIDWELSRTMEEEFVIKTVEKAKTERKIKSHWLSTQTEGAITKQMLILKQLKRWREVIQKCIILMTTHASKAFFHWLSGNGFTGFRFKVTNIAGALFLNISKLFTTQSGYIHTVALLHQTNMKQSLRIKNLKSVIKRQLKSQFWLGYLLTEEH